jgi:hypothetical protein
VDTHRGAENGRWFLQEASFFLGTVLWSNKYWQSTSEVPSSV